MTNDRTKADFRALRDTVGVNQKTLGLILGNTTDMVKKWESEKFTYRPPADAWALLDRLAQQQKEAVDAAVEAHSKAGMVTLRYYRSQPQHDQATKNREDFEVANARARSIGAALTKKGVTVHYEYPSE
jgi:hypothetical protein